MNPYDPNDASFDFPAPELALEPATPVFAPEDPGPPEFKHGRRCYVCDREFRNFTDYKDAVTLMDNLSVCRLCVGQVRR